MTNNTRKSNSLVLILLVAAVVGVYISYTLLQEDVLSTAKTLFEYFPARFGVTPASTWDGAILLGWFVTVTQIVAAGVAFRKGLPIPVRIGAGLLLALSLPFDCWTDVVERSARFTGDIRIAIITTVSFYTFGSETMQSLSWLVIFTTWREGVREAMWVSAKVWSGITSIAPEWQSIRRMADNKEQRDVQEEVAGRNKDLYTTPQQRSGGQQYRPAPRQTPNQGAGEPTYHPVSYPGKEREN